VEEVINTLGNFGSPLDYVYLVLREVVALGIVGPSPGKKESDVPLGFVSLRQPQVRVTDVLLSDALHGWHGPASPEASIGPDAVRGHQGLLRGVEDISALTAGGS